MELYIAGGCSEHGRNSFLVRGKHVRFLVDAGRMKEKPDEPFPVLGRDEIGEIDYLFLTHCHTDHAGAISWLAEQGFHGVVVGSAATIRNVSGIPGQVLILEEHSHPLEALQLREDLAVSWGRAGHCIGSVWFSFRVDSETILFTGDYEEKSYAYECDHIRGRTADIAVIDCAYGTEKEDASAHWEALEHRLDELVGQGKPLLFPVPSHGRGFDVLKLLADRGQPVVAAESLREEYRSSPDRDFWLKPDFLSSIKNLKLKDIHVFDRAFREAYSEGKNFPEECLGDVILVRDSQLVKGGNRMIAAGVAETGGRTILTGKQDPASFARKLLNDGHADFLRISVHQNIDEMRSLMEANEFGTVVPYHCRVKLEFDDPGIAVLSPGDTLNTQDDKD